MGAYITRQMSRKLQGEDEATLRSGEAESSIGMAQTEAEDDGKLNPYSLLSSCLHEVS
jgi:hypothetical protein